MIVKALETKYGQIYGRDALILTGTELNLYPFNFTIKASLSLSACKPAIKDAHDVSLEIFISKIEKLSIYKVDDYPLEQYTTSSFDLVEDIQRDGVQHIIISTYDHVFDIIGIYEIKYC
ncbi:hypothetical protein ACQHMR_21605 [Escherichia coli]|uniref:hypothetical protein n=1 Tax=Escherichia coli TaxID=562 RepID=UPI003CF5C392